MSISSISTASSSVDYTQMRKELAEKVAAKLMADLDTDGDGAISKAELQKASQAASASSSGGSSTTSNSSTSSIDELFSALDTNGDGSISKSELSAFIEKADSQKGGTPRTATRSATHGRRPPRPLAAQARRDANNTSADSTSTAARPVQVARSLLIRRTRNQDGTVSAQERIAYAFQAADGMPAIDTECVEHRRRQQQHHHHDQRHHVA